MVWFSFVTTIVQADEAVVQPLPVADEGGLSFQTYTSDDGLNDEIWNSVGIDREGQVWAGSASRLARFDGYGWQLEDFPQARSLVRDMALAPDGKLYAAFGSEGLAARNGHGWKLVDHPGGAVRRFSSAYDGQGRPRQMWLVAREGLYRWTPGGWLQPSEAKGYGGIPVDIERSDRLQGGPRLWVGTETDGLWFRDLQRSDARWQRFRHPVIDQMPLSDLLRTESEGREELWLVSYNGGLARLREDGGVDIWRAADGSLPSEAMYTAVASYSADGTRNLWVATRGGLLHRKGESFQTYDRRHGLPSDAVRGLLLTRTVDAVPVLWLATENGVARAALTESPWRTLSLLGARNNGVYGLLLEPDGEGSEQLWIGTGQEGLARLHAGQWRYFNEANGLLPSNGVRTILRLPVADGYRRWVSLNDGQLLDLTDEDQPVPVTVPWRLQLGSAITDAVGRVVDGQPDWWFGHQRDGIYHHDGSQWVRQTVNGLSGDWVVLDLLEQVDAHGRRWLWAASQQGLARHDGESWELLTDLPGMPDDGLRAVALIDEGDRPVLWVGSNQTGIARLDVSDPAQPAVAPMADWPAPPDPTVYSVLQDSQGRVYICTNNGVQQLTPTAAGGFSERVMTRRDGLVHDECNTLSQAIDRFDRYFVGTLGGLSVYDPAQAPAAARIRPKRLLLTDLQVDGRSLQPPDHGLQIEADIRELRLGYTLQSGLREGESRYRTRLLGYETDFGNWTAEHQRSFSSLPPGDYRFQVEARDYAGIDAEPIELAFTVQAAWWEQPWVQLALLTLLALLAALAVLIYNRNLRLRQIALRKEVSVRTAELRAANSRLTELSYQDPLTGVANRRRLTEVLENERVRAHTRQRPLGLIVADVDHFKAYNDQHGHLAGDVALRAVAQALQQAVRPQDLVARFGGEEFCCLLLDADEATVQAVAERMRQLVQALTPRQLGNEQAGLTVSLGYGSRIPASGDAAGTLIEWVDQALYQAKREGRNRALRAD
ncbi:MAG: diguanylate cyclase [Lysobacterales bacterium]